MSKSDNVTLRRLGVARKALQNIKNYSPDRWESYDEIWQELRFIAEQALEEMEKTK